MTRRHCDGGMPHLPNILSILGRVSIREDKSLSKGGITGLSAWFNRGWSDELTWRLILNHIIMIGPQFDTNALDSPMWSLIHEMRISIIFPLLMVMIIRWNWKLNVGIGLIFSMIAVDLQSHYHSLYQPVYKSLAYILMFIVGALLAKYREGLRGAVSRIWSVGIGALFVGGILFYILLDWTFNNHFLLKLKSLDDLETLIGAAIIIVLAVSHNATKRLLNIAPIRYTGSCIYMGIYRCGHCGLLQFSVHLSWRQLFTG